MKIQHIPGIFHIEPKAYNVLRVFPASERKYNESPTFLAPLDISEYMCPAIRIHVAIFARTQFLLQLRVFTFRVRTSRCRLRETGGR